MSSLALYAPDTVRSYLRLSRPFTLLPPLVGILSGAVCAYGSAHLPEEARRLDASTVGTVILGSLCAGLMNAASNALNQITDLDIDRHNKPDRPLVTGALGGRAAWTFVVIAYALALLPVWLVVPYPYRTLSEKLYAPASEHGVFFLFFAALVLTVVYSVPAFGRTKARGMLANLTIAVPRGVLLKVAGWGMVARVDVAEPWCIGAVFGLFLLGAASTKDFADIEGDRFGGCRTLPIVYGVRNAALAIAPSFVLPWLLVPLFVAFPDPSLPGQALLTGSPGLLLALSATLAAWGTYTVYLLLRDPDSLARSENHPSWKHMYLMMLCAQIGFALAYLA